MKKYLFRFLVLTMVLAFVFTFVFLCATTPVFAAEVEETAENTTEVTESTANTLFEFIKHLNMNDFRGWLVALITKLGIDTALIFSTLIYIIRARVKETRTDAYYKELVAKLDAEHQKKLEEVVNSYDEKLQKLSDTVISTIKRENNEKREEAQATVDKAKAALDEIKIGLDE